MRTRLLAILATVSLVVLLGATSARADQITLGDSCSGTLTVNPAGPTVSGTVSSCGATWEHGSAPFTDVGVWGFSSSSNPQFATGTYVDTTSSLAGNITWTSFSSGSDTLDGYITVTSVTGFNGEYTVGGVYSIDLTFQGGSCAPNTDQVLVGCKVSSGEIPTPEPGTLTLLGTGLLTMAGFIRRKLHS